MVERSALEGYLAGLQVIEDLPRPEVNLANLMFTKGMVSDSSGSNTVAAGLVLWDTGDLGPSFFGEDFYNAHKVFFEPMTEVEDSSVSLADGVTVCKITKKVRTCLTVRGVGDQIAHIKTVFSVIPMPPNINVILGLKDMVFEAPDMLVAMIDRAVKHVKHVLQAEREAVVEADRKAKKIHIAIQTSPGQPRRVHHPRPYHKPTDLEVIMIRGRTGRTPVQRPRTDIYAISLVDGKTFDESLDDLTTTEVGQDVRPVWTSRDDLGHEETDSPYPGMFSDALHFMEVPIETARAEYIAELRKPPAEPPPTTPMVDGAVTADKPAKRQRFHPDMYGLEGFLEYMESEAIDVFVPTNWQGIRVPPIEFNFKPDMPQTYRGKSRPINHKRADIVKREFDRLRQYHLTETDSPIVSPITDADKATAPFVRICGDYRWINTQILLNHEHIPHVRHELEKFSGFKYFIDLDMVNSFHQFRLAMKTSERLSVITPWGSFRPVFMPEGVSPATGVLQGHMRDIFSDFKEWAVVIFDNFCLGGSSPEDLFAKLKLFIARCKEFNIFLKMSKCFFGHDSVKFFGYEVSGKGWKIDDERKAAIKAIPFPSGPTTKIKVSRMQSFLGFSLYFRDFVDGYSTKAGELYDMTSKTFDWREETWTRNYRALFETFKDDMCKSFELVFPDWSLPWVLQPDASNIGIGAILFQIRTLTGDDGVEYTRREPIACVSQKFSDPATRWAVIKQEMYAIYRSVEKLSYYLKHKSFQVQTDHSNLVQMEKSSVGIITRWRCFLQSFPIRSIIHIAGKDNVAADFLSRVHECDRDLLDPIGAKSMEPPLNFLAAVCFASPHGPDVDSCDELEGFNAIERREFNITCSDTNDMCCSLLSPCRDGYCGDCGEDNNLVKMDAVLASLGAATQPADADTYTARIPRYDAMIEGVHGGAHLHFGALATWRLLQQQCVGHGIPMAYVRFYVRECAVCQKYRRTLSNDRIPHIIRHLKVPGPRSTIGIDGFTMTPVDRHGNSYMHVLVNHFTKHVFLFPSKLKNAEGAANAIITYVSMFGRFNRVMTDPGSDYGSDIVSKLNTYFDNDHAFSLVDRHESNGVEAVNRELKRHIQTLVHDKRFADRWSEPQVLGLITFHINNQRNSESGYSAFDCTFGSLQADFFRSMDVASANLAPDSKFVEELTRDIAIIQEKSRDFQECLVAARATDLTKPRNQWAPGDLVFVDNLSPLHKLQAPRLGPYEVVSHHRNDVTLRDLISSTIKDFHVDRLSLFSGSMSDAFDLAMRDRDQHLIERFLGYRGNVAKRETLEFLIAYTDDPIPVWKAFEKDISDTEAFESFCKSLPQLEPLLSTAIQAAARKSELSKTRTDVTHQEGDIIFVDIRSREIYEHEWYNILELEGKDIIPRYSRMRVGQCPKGPGIRAGTRVELLDDVFELVHRVDAYFLCYNGTMHTEEGLPEGSEVITRAFAIAHPYNPVDRVRHRRMIQADFALLAYLPRPVSDSKNFRVLSYNMNGIDAAMRNGFLDQLKNMEGGPPDVLILQETRTHFYNESLLERRFEALGYHHFKMICSAPHFQGGVAVATKIPFATLDNGPGVEQGASFAMRIDGVTIVDIHAPAVCSTQPRMIKRRSEFDTALLAWIPTLPEPVLIGGDFNHVPDNQRDIVRHRRNPTYGANHFTSEVEGNLFSTLTTMGFVDVYRALHPTARAYTVHGAGAWQGMRARTDYFMASATMAPDVTACKVHTLTPVSDHSGVEVSVRRQGTDMGLWFPFYEWSLTPPTPIPARFFNWFEPPAKKVEVFVGMVLIEPVYLTGPLANQAPPPPTPTALSTVERVDDLQLIQAAEEAEADELERAISLSLTSPDPTPLVTDLQLIQAAEQAEADIAAAAVDEADNLFPLDPTPPVTDLQLIAAAAQAEADIAAAAGDEADFLFPDTPPLPLRLTDEQLIERRRPEFEVEEQLRQAEELSRSCWDDIDEAIANARTAVAMLDRQLQSKGLSRLTDEGKRWDRYNYDRRRHSEVDYQLIGRAQHAHDQLHSNLGRQRDRVDLQRQVEAGKQARQRELEALQQAEEARRNETQEERDARLSRQRAARDAMQAQWRITNAELWEAQQQWLAYEAEQRQLRTEAEERRAHLSRLREVQEAALEQWRSDNPERWTASEEERRPAPRTPENSSTPSSSISASTLAQSQEEQDLLQAEQDAQLSPWAQQQDAVWRVRRQQAAEEFLAEQALEAALLAAATRTERAEGVRLAQKEADERGSIRAAPASLPSLAEPKGKRKSTTKSRKSTTKSRRVAPTSSTTIQRDKPEGREKGDKPHGVPRSGKKATAPELKTPPRKRLEHLRHIPWQDLNEAQQMQLILLTPSPLSSAPTSDEEGKCAAKAKDAVHQPVVPDVPAAKRKLTATEWDELHEAVPAAAEQPTLVLEEAHPNVLVADDGQERNYRALCDTVDLDWSISSVPTSHLRVSRSRYGFIRGGVLVHTVGDALTATVDILPGQRIAQFFGTEISADAAADLPDGSNNYLITIADEIVLNCEDTARARPIPRCFASNANMAEGLHNAGVTLDINGNNASADLSNDRHGRPIAWLYAVVFIAAGDEIMWSYGDEYADGFDVSEDDSDSDWEPSR